MSWWQRAWKERKPSRTEISKQDFVMVILIVIYRLNPGYWKEHSRWSPCARHCEVHPPSWIPEADEFSWKSSIRRRCQWKSTWEIDVNEMFTWEEGSLNPAQTEGDWRLIGLRRASAELLGIHVWISPGCGGWIGGNGIVISGNNPSDDMPPLDCSICRQFDTFFRYTGN